MQENKNVTIVNILWPFIVFRFFPKRLAFFILFCYTNIAFAGVMELADVLDSKSSPGNRVRVRPPPPAPYKRSGASCRSRSFVFLKFPPACFDILSARVFCNMQYKSHAFLPGNKKASRAIEAVSHKSPKARRTESDSCFSGRFQAAGLFVIDIV